MAVGIRAGIGIRAVGRTRYQVLLACLSAECGGAAQSQARRPLRCHDNPQAMALAVAPTVAPAVAPKAVPEALPKAVRAC